MAVLVLEEHGGSSFPLQAVTSKEEEVVEQGHTLQFILLNSPPEGARVCIYVRERGEMGQRLNTVG